MSATGIIPDPGYGGIVVTTLPAPVGVTNAYVPPGSFTVSSPLTFYGMNCSANRFDPQQLNAFESEMIALAATLAPNGTWNTGTVTNLAAAFQTWAQTIVAGTLSLSPSSAYPGASASNITAATPGYVTAAIAAATGASFSIVNAADYPSLASNDTRPISPLYWTAAFDGSLATSGAYPSTSSTLAATPSFVNSAIAAATTTIEATIPALEISSSYPSDSNNTTAATPAYVALARNAAEAAIPALAIASTYPDTSNDTKAATPAYVNAAVAAAGGATTLAALTDVTISTPANNQSLMYNTGASKWENLNTSYNIAVSITGVMVNSEVLLQYVFPQAVKLPASLTGSQAKAGTAATASTVVTINKNGSSIGTITWAISGTVATFSFSSAISFAAGDILSLVAPVSADATLANVGITLAGFLL